jgi:hypothetical protein
LAAKFKYLGIFILVVLLVVLYYYANPGSSIFYPKCPLYATTGIYCPGCGSQRATHNLLNFNLVGVAKQNLLYILGIILIAYHLTIKAINYIFNKNIYNIIYHPITPIIVLIVTILFWILRNLPFYPFTLLAPQ